MNNDDLDGFLTKKTCEEYFSDEEIPIIECKYSKPEKKILCNAPNKEYNSCFHGSYYTYPASGGRNGCKWKNPQPCSNEEEYSDEDNLLSRAEALKVLHDFEDRKNTDLSLLIQEAQLELTKAQTSLAYEQTALAKEQILFYREYNLAIVELINILKEQTRR